MCQRTNLYEIYFYAWLLLKSILNRNWCSRSFQLIIDTRYLWDSLANRYSYIFGNRAKRILHSIKKQGHKFRTFLEDFAAPATVSPPIFAVRDCRPLGSWKVPNPPLHSQGCIGGTIIYYYHKTFSKKPQILRFLNKKIYWKKSIGIYHQTLQKSL